jgi:hypothetical protein
MKNLKSIASISRSLSTVSVSAQTKKSRRFKEYHQLGWEKK